MNDHLPLISVISPAYNHEKYIAECIQSVQAQTYTNWEMIIIDDGSSDSTFSIATEYAGRDPRIRPFTQKNVGIFRLAESYNFALKQSSGRYIAILECDDLWLPDKLQKQVDILEQNPQSVLSWGKAWLATGDLSHKYSLAPADEPEKDINFNKPPGIFLERLMKSGIPALTVVIRREALDETGGFLQGFGLPLVDMPTIVEMVMKGEFAFVQEPLGYWRIYPNQVTKTYTVNMTKGMYSLFLSITDRYPVICTNQGLTRGIIDEYFKNRLIISYSRSGRYKLIRKDFIGARKDYIQSITHYGLRQPVWKLRSLTGIFFSLFRMDIEWLARLLGHDSYK
ncbi:MAG TPA: glycosyltransferase [Bacteroidales bacterium]|nr:glycosyltransferase [Bacteroidales bacterium]